MDSHDLSDGELLERIRTGNRPAFAVLVRRHTDRFYRLAYRFTANREQAEDIVQDAFLKLWERPALWEANRNAKFTTWFYRVVVNLALDAKKKKMPLPLAEGFDIEDERQGEESRLIEQEHASLLEQAIAGLPERQRVALNLCFYEGLSNQEAADIMGVKLKALQSLIVRAKDKLKDSMIGKGEAR